MAVDSLQLFCAGLLFAASIGGWILSASCRAAARLYLRFAAMLFAALAVSAPLELLTPLALFLLPLAAAALMIASFARLATPLPVLAASLALITGLACGLAAMLWDSAMPALVPVMFASLAIVGVALNAIAVMAVLAGTSLLAAGLVLLEQGTASAMLLFAAAALIGLAKSPRAEKSALAIQH
jgi:hypothetical protein